MPIISIQESKDKWIKETQPILLHLLINGLDLV